VRAVILLGVLCVVPAACGAKSSPTGPSSTTTTIPAATTITLTGHLTATNGGQALAGVQAVVGASTSVTDGAGLFRAELPPSGGLRLALTGPAIVPRSLSVATGTTRDLAVSAIALGGTFDLTFYRALVRNGFEAPAALQPLRRWTENPNIYLRTVDDAGTSLDAKTLDATEAVVREMVPTWSAGTLAAVVTRGTGTQDGVANWITIHWQSSHNLGFSDTAFCGNSLVGANPGLINLTYAGICRCAGVSEIRARTVRHEIGHAMGFWHTGDATDLMSGLSVNGCDQRPSAREFATAAIAYTRPVGNLDPDSDPSSVVALSPMVAR
jgi:hypothetical protein